MANRWQTRLKPTAEWLEARLGTTPAGGADGIARFFQYAARRDRDRMRLAIESAGACMRGSMVPCWPLELP